MGKRSSTFFQDSYININIYNYCQNDRLVFPTIQYKSTITEIGLLQSPMVVDMYIQSNYNRYSKIYSLVILDAQKNVTSRDQTEIAAGFSRSNSNWGIIFLITRERKFCSSLLIK